MSGPPFAITRLSGQHDRASFTCGVEPLDRYFRQQASQDSRRRVAVCFVLTETATGAIAGYYTLAASHLLMNELPAGVITKLPRYPAVPAVLIGRLAVASAFQGRRLGGVLLADAVERAAHADLASFVVTVDPKDESARRFYERYGFADLPASGGRMFLPVESALRFLRLGEP